MGFKSGIEGKRLYDAARNASPDGRTYLTAIMAYWREANRGRYNKISANSRRARRGMAVIHLDRELNELRGKFQCSV